MRSLIALCVLAPGIAGSDGGGLDGAVPDAAIAPDALSDAGSSLDASVTVAPTPVVWDPAQRSVRVLRNGEAVRTQPRADAPRRGSLAAGARFAVLEAVSAPGCRNAWVRIATEAWVCSDVLAASALEPAATEQPELPPNAGGLPFRYARPRQDDTLLWRSLSDVGDLRRGVALRRDNTLAVREVLTGRSPRIAVISDGRVLYERDLVWIPPATTPSGHFYRPGATVDSVVFCSRATRGWPTAALALTGTSRDGPREIAARRVFVVRDERSIGGTLVWFTDRGWVRSGPCARPTRADPPANLQRDERWLDVDRRTQIAVAYEGTTPRWAALVSTGRAGHATTQGTFRLRSKHAWDDMSNVGSGASFAELYFVAAVPWVQYFHGGQALHGAFWHDEFGTARSHGCVNLAPADARWLFGWAPPLLPPGFTQIQATRADPGMIVRVR